MRISGIEPSSVILSQTMKFKKLKITLKLFEYMLERKILTNPVRCSNK